MALSLALHGLAVILLFAAGASGSATSSEPALFVELAVAVEKADAAAEQAAPTALQPSSPTTESKTSESQPSESPTLDQPTEPPVEPPVEPPPEPGPPRETAIELPLPDEPPPPDLSTPTIVELAPPQEPPPIRESELKPMDKAKSEPPKPAPPAKPQQARAAARTAATMAATTAANNAPTQAQPFGTGSEARQAASGFVPVPAVVWEGKPRYRHPPTPAVYPSRAIELNQHGEVLVRVRLDTEGGAVEILLHRSSGHVSLDQAALTAVRGWHFLPAQRDGRPVPSWVEIPVRFHLR
ncbi:hypothetical protein BH11PSE3_BH11PSE3_02840 [soil metagenome]